MSAAYTVADHLVDRLAELDVDRVFGVPGDYSLGLLDRPTGTPGSAAWPPSAPRSASAS